MTTVPNKPPILSSHLRIALVGEAPGKDEVATGEPFVGASGSFLSKLLTRAGIQKEACFVGNVCQHQPHANWLANFEWNGDEIQGGIHYLLEDLDEFKPNIVVCLGGAPLQVFKEQSREPKKGKNGFRWHNSPTNYRGSLFQSPYGYKCLSTLHPAFCLRSRSDAPLLQFDLKKAVKEGASPTLTLPKRLFQLGLSSDAIIYKLAEIRKAKTPIALDIEGYVGAMSCVSIATAASEAFIIPFFNKDYSSYFPNNYSEARVWRAFAELMEDADVPKCLQNSLYDRFVLHYSFGIRVRGVVDDTMLKWWELYAELEKSLSVQASICTNEPYYKGERKAQDDATFFSYCCRDSSVTYEINSVLNPRVHGTSLTHYRLNVALLHPLLYMEMRGMAYDNERAVARRADIRRKMFEEQARLNGLSGRYVKSNKEIHDKAYEKFYYKKATKDMVGTGSMVRKPEVDNCRRCFDLLSQPSPSAATIGELEDLLGVSLNVDSKGFKDYLYNELNLPTQYAKAKKDSDLPPSITADYEALIKLVKHCEKERPEVTPIIQRCIEIRSLSTREGMLGISSDKDGRIRCGYNLVGSETGRITCYTSPTGSGYNLQTIPKEDRDLFLADDGHWFFQCDLSGADGWTVAAYSAMLGDSTMLDDYRAGLKPAKILVLALRGTKVDFTNREELRKACKAVSADEWDYFAMKRVQHGCSYLEGEVTVSNQILTDSEGKFFIAPKDCRILRDGFFFKRYPGIQRWHRWCETKIRERPTIIAASGQVRHFFGTSDEILPKFVAHEPQANTTYATNLAMYRLWTDRDNRHNGQEACDMPSSSSRLRIEPLHQVHDALCGQFRKSDTTWAVGKIQSWFDNPLIIAGQRIVIPFDGGYASNWKQAGSEKEREGVI